MYVEYKGLQELRQIWGTNIVGLLTISFPWNRHFSQKSDWHEEEITFIGNFL